MGSGKRRWKISFQWSPSPIRNQTPKEFTCPLSGSLMADPVIVSSGQTFERNCVQSCKILNFKPVLSDGSTPNFSAVIPNLALKSAILNWCNAHLVDPPEPVDEISAEKIVRTLMDCPEHQSLETHNRTQWQVPKSVKSVRTRFPSRFSPSSEELRETHNKTQSQVPEARNSSDNELTRFPGQLSSSSEELRETHHKTLCQIPKSRNSEDIELTRFPSQLSSTSEELRETHIKTQWQVPKSRISVGTRAQSQLSSSSEESVVAATSGSSTPLPFYSYSSSSPDIETLNPSSSEEDDIVSRLRSLHVFEQEEAATSLRNMTRTGEDSRARLCTPRLLSAVRSLIASRYAAVQVNAVAALVNLSLENQNKVRIVRSGIVPPLIDVLKAGFPEAQDHAAGALFSLALDNHNKTAIGVLGALPPLLHALRSESEQTRNDSALALYHLSLVQSNRVKLVKLGSVQTLLGMVKMGHMTGRVLLVLSNLAFCVEGRAVMLDVGTVEVFVGMLSRDRLESESTRDTCVTALYGLSHGGLRFKGLAKEAGAEEVLRKVEEVGSERARVKARRVLEVMRRRDEEEEEVDWEALLNSEEASQTL
ncbi:hypothetical protein RHMOL_Rhmol10G0035400 [Rhododendron molle]|uniref:Uncharacterized protein n=2 Tax=Rhododendron molle TaxID=49168 RepID=A0ACC0LZ43_RHOML|nr:hypothetical protein RHMOL_Rhmol10G0035400 [Rhododendron molle]KAI8533777.1 hypothetical protein RHMOL_Rhmol10G0035400 [Rhododendron molle]